MVGGGGDYGRAPSGATPGGAKAKEGSRFIASPIPPDIRLPRPPCVLEGVLSSRFAQPEFKVRCWQPLLVKLTGNRSGEGKEASGRATGTEPPSCPVRRPQPAPRAAPQLHPLPLLSPGPHSAPRSPGSECSAPGSEPGGTASPPALSSPDSSLWF